MPVEFLSAEQERRYGRYGAEPTPEQLDTYFQFDDRDRAAIAARHGAHNRLGFGVQLATVRFLGTFLADPLAVPPGAVAYLAAQLAIADPGCLAAYSARPSTHWDHAAEIQRRYGYRDFAAQPEHFRLVRWMYTRAWLSAERPSLLFDLATARCVEHKVLLPGVTTLARLVAQVRERAGARLWRILAAAPRPEQRARLLGLLELPADGAPSPLERLRRPPTAVSAPGLVEALTRLAEIRALGVSALNLTRIPSGHLAVLARTAATSWPSTLAHLSAERKLASLLAFARVFEVHAQDEALDLLDLLLERMLARTAQKDDQTRLRSLRALEAAALQLRTAVLVLLAQPAALPDQPAAVAEPLPAAAEPPPAAAEPPPLLDQVYAQVPRANLAAAADTVGDLARPPEDTYYAGLATQYPQVRRFLPPLLRTIRFYYTPGGRAVVDAYDFLRGVEGAARPKIAMRKAPRAVVPRDWRKLVLLPKRRVDRTYLGLSLR